MADWEGRFKQIYPGIQSGLQGQLPGIQAWTQTPTVQEQQLGGLTGGAVDLSGMDWYRQATKNAIERGQNIAERAPEGFTPEQQRAITAGAYSATAAPYAAAGEELRRQAQRTGSPTALAGNLAGLARQRSMGLTQVAGQLPQQFHDTLASDIQAKSQMTSMPGQLAEQAKRGELAGFQPILEAAKLPLERFSAGMGALSDFYKNLLGESGQVANLAGIKAGKAGWGDVAKGAVGSWLSRPSGGSTVIPKFS